uniref:SEFIR domain-containing protein n=1 Tax=Neogobius melanostomus TaxID=47308 RepID=A0A8C6WPK8_9GOBI
MLLSHRTFWFLTGNCLDPDWLRSYKYTPSGPDQLDLRISTRRDSNGNLLPVINASWTLKDDGGIMVLKASELQVMMVSTNQNICVRYSFNNKLEMRSPTGEQWTLRSDVLVVDPGQMYRVSVENIPKPELDHSVSSISREVSVPGKRRVVCVDGAECCCVLCPQIKPFFSRCGDDCRRRWSIVDICNNDPPVPHIHHCRAVCQRGASSRQECSAAGTPTGGTPHPALIYSRDHPLFLEVVLKLAAFLQAHCGILVLLDLLDSSAVSQVGLMRWLELQRNKLRPNDKILVLCSRGVQSKWRAMCGQGHVTHQPDDLIGPFLSLFLSDMHRPGSMGRYIAAHFEEISSEHEVPSFFDIAVKYKLMKHFEELYFRVLDMEKYEPRKVNHIQGIGPDEYFRCPSGRLLRNAIEKFHAFQIDNPDWFEKGQTEDVDNLSLLIGHTQQLPQITERIPIVNEGTTISPMMFLRRKICPILHHPHSKCSYNFSKSVCLELQPDLCPSLAIFQSDVIPVTPTEDQQVAGASARQNGESVAALSRRPQPVEMAEAGAAGFPWSKADTSGSDQGYSSNAWTEPDSDDLRALMLLQQELMNNTCHHDAQ